MNICICQIINNEHPYIEEWIEYHHSLGIEKFYLIEDFNSKSHKEILKKYDYVELYSLLDIINDEERKQFEDGEYRQRIVYRIFLRLWADKYDYMAFIDVDEFIEVTKEQLQELLTEGKNYATIRLTWKTMSSEGYIRHPNNGNKYSVLETYKNYNFSIEHCKQIVNCSKEFRNDITNKFRYFPHDFKDVKILDKKVYLKHFLYKSFEEYFTRLTKRGEITLRYPRKFDDWFKGNPDMLPQKDEIYKIFNVNEKNVKLNLMYERRKSIVCAIVKNEQRFIREWAEYYLSVGFDKLYIFEDFGSDSHEYLLKDLIANNKIELCSISTMIPQYAKGTQGQKDLYSKFLEKCKEKNLADWCGFFDIDEFISFEEGYNLSRIEEEFNDYGGVLLSWRIFGANGHIKRPDGKVVDNYTTYIPDSSLLIQGSWQWNVKSLVNVRKCKGLNHIHWFKGCKLTDMTDGGHLCFEKAWINHYYSKSWEDYLDRIFARGNMNNNLRCLDLFFETNPDMLPIKEKLVNEQRYRKTASTMWISRDMKIIAGGNERKLKSLNSGK